MNEIMNTAEVAKLFHITEMTVYKWRKSGKLRSYKQGSKRIFLTKDVEKLRVKETQMRLDVVKRNRSALEIRFFEKLQSKLNNSESMQLIISPLDEHDYHKFIVEMAEKYNVKIPHWLKKECEQFGVEI